MKTFGAVVFGYVVTALVVYGGLAIAWSAMGAEDALEPGRWEPTDTWILTTLVVGLLAAILGGFAAAHVSGGTRAPRMLAVVVFVLGVAMAMPTLGRAVSEAPRLDGPIPMTIAIQETRTPSWVAFANAFLGAGGVLIGAQRRFAGLDRSENP